jgi:hypothetical protein
MVIQLPFVALAPGVSGSTGRRFGSFSPQHNQHKAMHRHVAMENVRLINYLPGSDQSVGNQLLA